MYNNNKKAYITIDMEVPQTPFMKGLVKAPLYKERYEYAAILDICHSYDIPVTFFLNVYEDKIWGKEYFKEISKEIIEKGSDIQLHTHPYWICDKQRIHMWQYDIGEQEKIIEYGNSKIYDLTGENAVVHRAGAYGADINTMFALKKNGIMKDSSFFWGHSNCKLNNYEVEQLNSTQILQVEILTFKRKLACDNNILKFDIDWLGLPLLLKVIHDIDKSRIENTILFLHSSSFMKWDRDYIHYKLDYKKILNFIIVIENMLEKGFKFDVVRNVNGDVSEAWHHDSLEIGAVSHRINLSTNAQFNNVKEGYMVNTIKEYYRKNEASINKMVKNEFIHDEIRDFVKSSYILNSLNGIFKKARKL